MKFWHCSVALAPASATGLAISAAPELPSSSQPQELITLPLVATLMIVCHDTHHHGMPVITVVPVVMPGAVRMLVGAEPAPRKIVAVVEVAVVVRMPLAVTRSDAFWYR